jgi:hypothetical protein
LPGGAADGRKGPDIADKARVSRKIDPKDSHSGVAAELMFMALENMPSKWTMPNQNWSQELNHLAIKFEGRITVCKDLQ